MAFKNKRAKPPQKLTRKQQRKEKRIEKKVRRNDFFSKKKHSGTLVLNPEKNQKEAPNKIKNKSQKEHLETKPEKNFESHNQVLTTEQIRKKEKKEQHKLETEMKKQRNKQFVEANKDEDKIIRQMEKQLGLKKRKSKSIPKNFAEDGLDFLLEVVDPEYLKHTSQQAIEDVDNDFEEDLALMAGKQVEKTKLTEENDQEELSDEEEEDNENESNFEGESNEELDKDDLEEVESINELSDDEEQFNTESDDDNEESKINAKKSSASEQDCDISDEYESDNNKKEIKMESKSEKRKSNQHSTKNKKQKLSDLEKDDIFDNENEENYDFEEDSEENNDGEKVFQKGAVKQFPDGTWEDIYGRLRAKDGSIITKNETQSKYIPPAMREKMTTDDPQDKKRQEKLNRLKKQIKGLLNRLAESNMYSIAIQIEDFYMNNSRNDMNETLTNLIMESLVAEVLTPERLLIEHMVLLTVLHANVGAEVGAHFLQQVIRMFEQHLNSYNEVENKTLDNIICIIAQLYNFKLFDAKLIYEVLQKLANNFKEKDIECILHVLRSVGFSLRKDDPLALKNLILDLQNRANNATNEEKDNSRVKFMLDILLAIKNNNVTKIPNYDVSYSEHLKKVMKGIIRKGNYVTELNISLDDLLQANTRGRWWVVGSAWTGNDLENAEKSEKPAKTEGFSSKLLELARKQRMNTDIRRNIFCIIMSAEDYLDAFEKLLKLGLKNAQDREIINIILHCCLQEKNYNPYYGFLAQKLCDFNRKYQLTIKYSIWDKLKAISDHSGSQLSNLAKLLIHLFIEKGLPISTLKIVQFSELDKVTLRFMRQILLGILLHKDLEASLSVFARVSQSEKLKMFRESLRLFIHHFLLRNLKMDRVPEAEKNLIEARAKMVEKVLNSKEVKIS